MNKTCNLEIKLTISSEISSFDEKLDICLHITCSTSSDQPHTRFSFSAEEKGDVWKFAEVVISGNRWTDIRPERIEGRAGAWRNASVSARTLLKE